MQNGWCEFNYDGGSGESTETRWVPSTIVEIMGETPSQGIIENSTTGTAVQSGASWDNTTYLGMLKNGDYVSILDVVNGWYKINFNGKPGYIPVYRVNIQQLGCIKQFTDLSTQPSWNGLNEKENLNSGTTIQIIGMQNGWYEFNYDGGSGEASETRWVPSSIVELTGGIPSQGIIEYLATGTSVQSGASWSDATYLGMLNNGDYVNILGVVNGWYKINFNGKLGYIPVYRVNIQQLGCIKQFTDLSTQPSWNGLNEKENLNSGTTIQIIGMQNGWYEFNYDGGSGESIETRWVPSSIVELTGGIPSQGIIEYLATGTSVQSEASWSNATYLGMLNNGDYVNILGVVNGWYKINFNGKPGYIPVYRVNIQQLGCIKQFTDLSTQASWNGLNEKENLNSGITIQIIGMKNGWYEFNYDGGSGEATETRWVPSSVVKLISEIPSQGTIEYSTIGTAVQSGPSWKNTTYLGTVSNGTNVSIVAMVNGWYEISYDETKGYIPVYRVCPLLSNSSSTSGVAGVHASANLIYFMKGQEGFAPSRYFDIGGTLTDGYGMTGNELDGVPSVISEADATTLLTHHVNSAYYNEVLNIIKTNGATSPLQREVDAFTDFAYNEGVGSFESSTLLKKYLAGVRGDELKYYFREWDKVKRNGQFIPNSGLETRRMLEWNIFCGNDVSIPGYNCSPSIEIVNSSDRSIGTVTVNNGYGANPY